MIPHSRPEVSAKAISAVVDALQHAHLSQGAEVASLEARLSDMFDGANAVAVSSGTSALYLALVALNVDAGSKVIIPSYACNALYAAVCHTGATPVCADIASDSVCIDADTVAPLIDDAVRAVIVPHAFGFAADVDAISELGIPVIEDCAQAIGGRYADGSLLGSKGNIAVLSFYGTKLVPAGEGGACITRDAGMAAMMRRLRNCDEQEPDPRAFNFKMPDLNAALAREQLAELPSATARRTDIARRFDASCAARAFSARSQQAQAVFFRYLVDAGSDVTAFLERSEEAGVACRRPIWKPIHETIGGSCPETNKRTTSLVSVPIYPGLTDDEITVICTVMEDLLPS